MQIKTGFLYHLRECKVCNPVKDKYGICISAENQWFYLINSVDEKRPYAHEKDHVVYLEKHQIEALKHRSYIVVTKSTLIRPQDVKAIKCLEKITPLVWNNIRHQVCLDSTVQMKIKKLFNKE